MPRTDEMMFATDVQSDEYNNLPPEIATETYLIFSSDKLMYGVKANQVMDIITGYSITYLPQVPGYVRGVINLRGQIIPIVDIRLRLGKMPQDNFCSIVVEEDGTLVGIVEDLVEQMVDVPLADILPVPTNNGSSQPMVSGMCTLPDGNTMLALDCEQLLHG